MIQLRWMKPSRSCTAEPGLAAPDRLLLHVHGCLRCGNETARQSSRDFDGSSKARARTMSPIVTRPEFAAGSAVYPSLSGPGRVHHRRWLRHWRMPDGRNLRDRVPASRSSTSMPMHPHGCCSRCRPGAAGPVVPPLRRLRHARPATRHPGGCRRVRRLPRAREQRSQRRPPRHVEVTPEYWDQRIAVNQRPAFFAIQAVVPGMRSRAAAPSSTSAPPAG